MRKSEFSRKTNETDIKVYLNLDGSGDYEIDTGFKFFNHMLEQLACHSMFDIRIKANSLDSDEHHLVEDTAIAIGSAIKSALGDKKGINRYGQFMLPMDDALVLCAVDLSGRAYSKVFANISDEKIADFSAIMIPHFFCSLAQSALLTVHIRQLEGTDAHHIAEAMFKSFARALKQAVAITNNTLPTTKGIL